MSERTQQMARMYVEEGLSYEQIGEQYGITRQRVGQILTPLRLTEEQTLRSRAERVHRLRESWEAIMDGRSTMREEATRLGYASVDSLRKVMHSEGMLMEGRPRPLPEHGTTGRYKRGCTCDLCRAANAAKARANRRRKGGPPQHGTESGYRNYGCLCARCRKAGRDARRKKKQAQRLREEIEL